MNVFLLSKRVLRDIINSLVIDDDVKEISIKVITHYDDNPLEFIYNTLKYYSSYYVNFYDNNVYLDYYIAGKVESAVEKISSKHKIFINFNDIFVVDVYDIIFCRAFPSYFFFKPSFYDLIYDRLSDLVGPKDALDYLDKVIYVIDNIFESIEKNLIFIFDKENYEDSYIIINIDFESREVLKILVLYPENYKNK